MAARYQHMIDPIRTQVAKQVGALIWEAAKEASATKAEGARKGKRKGSPEDPEKGN